VQVSEAADGAAEGMLENHDTAFYSHGLDTFAAGDFVVDQFKRERFFDQLREWRVAGWATYIFCNNEGEIERFHDLLPPVEAEAIRFRVGIIAHGFTSPAAKVAVISDAEIFGRYKNQRVHRRRVQLAHDPGARAQIDFSELIDGELVVHLEHGIAMYDGMRSISRGDGTREEVLVLEFAEQAKLYVPMEQAFLVSRYVGIGKKNPPLSALGDERWGKAKRNAEKAVYDYAARLLETHAQRETMRGFAFPEDTKWMREFEASFLYTETKDQLTAIQETKADMESERPMDRLICGDVGFGKTEVAIRAAFKAVTGGKQVAFLVPTTVLAEQHYRNLRERMSDYPFNIGLLSRFGTTADRRKVVEGLRAGTVDIVVGTNRLIGKEVSFKDLGLLIVDEEQRFGVLQKERLKAQFPLVDCLTLSATPIPRTLYMSLMGARDMSTIETPPTNRIPVETFVCPYDERIIRDAVQRERAREGQVYFLHNRIASIQGIAKKIENLCPGCRVVVGHGQMDEDELELVMKQFVAGEADVLVSTTIIESGLDIPNANTIIIDRADRFGLADLYQLRGRVGRSNQKAYAYLMLPPGLITVGEARRRINAIKQYGSLGAGFKIAMRDLEIRGAGNILGTAQSGHIITIGFELYCALLKQAVAKLRGDRPAKRADAVVRLDFVVLRESEWTGKGAASALAPAFLPAEYIGEAKERIQAYRRLHEAGRPEELEQLRGQWRDRYGRMPAPVENLLLTAEIRIAAAKRKVMIVEVREDRLMLTRGGDFLLIGGKFPRLQAESAVEKLREVLNFVGGL
jgi:transcription-repair coupling factor (superfamily II helicase)